jgi:hypothetical protein
VHVNVMPFTNRASLPGALPYLHHAVTLVPIEVRMKQGANGCAGIGTCIHKATSPGVAGHPTALHMARKGNHNLVPALHQCPHNREPLRGVQAQQSRWPNAQDGWGGATRTQHPAEAPRG